jgi:hypothetical protein
MTDPFSAPAKISSEFASADSFRGRLVLIKPTKLEFDVPNSTDPTKSADRLTADVLTVDGEGPVQIFSYKIPTGKFLEGPEHKGVWFSQERVVKAVVPNRVVTPGAMVLARLDVYKPGKPAGPGNPWGLVDPTEADKDLARAFLAGHAQNVAAATVAAASPAAKEENPFGGDAPF